MANFLFVLSRGFEDPTRVTRAFQFAKIAKDKGHKVDVFLVDDAVKFAEKDAVENIVAPTGDDAKTYFTELVRQGVPIHVCTPCAKARGVKEENFVENAKLSTGNTLIDLAAEAKVFTF